MKRTLFGFHFFSKTTGAVLVSACLSAGHSFAEAPQNTGLLNEQQRREKQRTEFLLEYTDQNGQLRPDLWRAGIKQYLRMPVSDTLPPAPQQAPLGPIVARHLQWVQIGPAPLRIDNNKYQGDGPDSGEVVDIAIDPSGTSDQVIYIAANDGGIWKSIDGGASWSPKTDFMPSLSMGAVALDPGNPSIVYAGTGNAYNNGFFKGIGVYRSTDGGETWTIPAGSSILDSLAINMIVLPAPNLLLVATGSGLYKSVDGGDHYGNNPPLFDNGLSIIPGSIVDLDLDTATPGTVYASVSGTGVRRSTDSGSSFGPSLFDASFPASFGYVCFAQSTMPDNQTMYVSIDTFGKTGQVFKSVNGGASWFELPNGTAQATGCQCGYDQEIGVDPLDADRVYVAWQQLYGSTDGGTNFTLLSADGSGDHIHWDHHAMVFSPHLPGGAPTRLYFGTDGGISYSPDGGATYANINEGIATCLFRGIDIGRGSAGNRGYSYGGCQDTGTVERRPSFAGNDWHLSIDGDGGPVNVDHVNPLRAYGSDNQYFILTSNGGDSWSFPNAAATGLPDAGDGFASAFPVGIDPNNNAVVYVRNRTNLFQSTDTGGTFASIHSFPSSIRELATASSDSSILWVSLNDRTVQITSNALAGAASTWNSVTVAGAPFGVPIGGIAIDPLDPAQVVVVYEGFTSTTAGTRTKHAFLTTDAGATWADISGTDGGDPAQNLPDLPLHSVVIDASTTPHTLIVASDAGVMRSIDLGATWQILGIGLPTVDCTSLAIDPSVAPPLLRVGTYGRSTFELAALTNVPIISVPGDVFFEDTCVGETNFATLYVCNTGDADLQVGPITSTNSQFAVVMPSSGYPVTISPDFCFPFRVQFTPTIPGYQQTLFIIPNNDPANLTNLVQGFGLGVGPSITAFVADSGNFGDVCLGSFRDLDLTINNSGGCTLIISNITSSSTQFRVPNVLNYPVVIHPGDSVALPIRFQPTSLGPKSGTIIIATNDKLVPNRIVSVSGNVPPGDVRVTGSTDFGDVCAGETAEKIIRVCNVGKCDLSVADVSFVGGCGEFVLVNNPFPAIVSPDSCMDVTIRYVPTNCGPSSCTLQVTTDR